MNRTPSRSRAAAAVACAAALTVAVPTSAVADESTQTITTCDTVTLTVQVPGNRVRLGSKVIRDSKTTNTVCHDGADITGVPDALAHARKALGARYHQTYRVPSATPAGRYKWTSTATRTITYTWADPTTGASDTQTSTTITRSYAKATIARKGRVASQQWNTHSEYR